MGELKNHELNRSHIGHQSKKRATAWETNHSELGQVSKWDWSEVEKAAGGLKNQIHKKMTKRRIESVGVLVGADKLQEQGIKFR